MEGVRWWGFLDFPLISVRLSRAVSGWWGWNGGDKDGFGGGFSGFGGLLGGFGGGGWTGSP